MGKQRGERQDTGKSLCEAVANGIVAPQPRQPPNVRRHWPYALGGQRAASMTGQGGTGLRSGPVCVMQVAAAMGADIENAHVAEMRDNWLSSVRSSLQMQAGLRDIPTDSKPRTTATRPGIEPES
jgi:hypothetical protein